MRTDISYDQELESLLAEGGDAARKRISFAIAGLGDVKASGVVLFGAGNLGRNTASGLRKVGIEPICFLDNNKSLWGQEVDGVRVLSPEQGAEAYGDRALFVVTIWRGEASDRMSSRVAHLLNLGCKRVTSFLPLYWMYPDALLPHYMHDLPDRVHAQADRVRQGFKLMADDVSRREYIAQVAFRLLGDFDRPSLPVLGDVYFRDELFELTEVETLVDCGAYDGDTLQAFLDKTAGSFTAAICFEPDPSNFDLLRTTVESLPPSVRSRVVIRQSATGETNTRVLMDVGRGIASQVGAGNCEVESVALDSALNGLSVTFIKMDIEGSELSTLAGARNLIETNKPILAICAYHRQSDIWNIPLFINEISSEYSIYLRPHLLEGWDLVCYALPRGRSGRR